MLICEAGSSPAAWKRAYSPVLRVVRKGLYVTYTSPEKYRYQASFDLRVNGSFELRVFFLLMYP
jgi:hypothetical protein